MADKHKYRKKEKNLIIILISIVLLFVIGIGAMIVSNNKNNNVENTTEEIKFYSYDDETFVINTKYCDLQYPITWEEYTEIVIKDEEPYVVEFYVKTADTNVHLFDLSFGKTDAYYLGTLKDSDVDLYLENYVIDENTMTNEEYNRCCAMEEDINVLISKLIEDSNFEIAK